MKKFLLALGVIAMTFSVTACGDDDNNDNNNDNNNNDNNNDNNQGNTETGDMLSMVIVIAVAAMVVTILAKKKAY